MTRPVPAHHGILVIDKPQGVTSRAAVNRVQAWFPGKTRIGHTGTLDPLATGVLVVCVGLATRLTEYIQQMDKVYRATIRLGARSDTDDAEGAISATPGVRPPPLPVIARSVGEFVGEIDQVPPAYSAARVSGERAYRLAHQGREVRLRPRLVSIYEVQLLNYEYPILALEIRCGKGTYIRSLARDLGDRLGCGGYIESLRRTRVGPFRERDALQLDADAVTARSRLQPPVAALAHLPRVMLEGDQSRRLRQGQPVPLPSESAENLQAGTQHVAAFDHTGRLVAVGRLGPQRESIQPIKVFHGEAS